MKTNDVEYLNAHYPQFIRQTGENFWHNFILLALDSSAFTFALAMLSQDTILPFFVSQLTASPILIGLVPAVYFLGYYAPQLFGAYLANRRSRRKPLILTIIIFQRLGILMIALTAQASGLLSPPLTLALFFCSFLIFSILNGVISPAYSDFISKHIIKLRGLFYGITYALGGLIGLLASLLAKRFLDILPYPSNIQAIFWTGFLFSFVSPFIISGIRETPLPYSKPPERLRLFFQRIPFHLHAQPVFLRYIAARALLGLGLMGNSFYAIYAIRRYGLSEGSLGFFTMIILLAQSTLSLIWGWIGHRFGYKVVLLAAGAFLAGEAILALTAPQVWVFYIIAFLIGGVYSATTISDPNFVFEIIPPQETSRFIGIANTLLAPVGVFAPLFGGSLVQVLNYPALFIAVLIIAVLALITIGLLVEDPRGKTAHPKLA
jgi:MFS family permease